MGPNPFKGQPFENYGGKVPFKISMDRICSSVNLAKIPAERYRSKYQWTAICSSVNLAKIPAEVYPSKISMDHIGASVNCTRIPAEAHRSNDCLVIPSTPVHVLRC